MNFSWKKAVAGAAIGSMGVLVMASQAGADTLILPNSGQDNVNNVVLQGGSDTTYVVQNDLAQLYNQSPGCNPYTGFTGSAPVEQLGRCKVANPDPNGGTGAAQTADAANLKTNWDHDIVTNVYPTGSGGGIAGAINNVYTLARSSKLTSDAAVSFWGFAKDGIALVTPPGRNLALSNPTGLTKQNVCDFYKTTQANWSIVTGQPAGTVHAYSMNTSSGTQATFNAFLATCPGGNATSATTKGEKISFSKPGGVCTPITPTDPFENDLKPILDDASCKGYSPGDLFWWGSFGELNSYAYKAQGAQYWTLDGVTIQLSTIKNDTWGAAQGLTRNLYEVAQNTVVDQGVGNGANLTVVTTGATSGPDGGARRYIEFLCQPAGFFTTGAALNPFTGNDYFKEQTDIVSKSGFQRIPGSAPNQRNVGACNVTRNP